MLKKIGSSTRSARVTGRYKGITGHGIYHAAGEALLRKTKAGACDQNGAPKVELVTIEASGPVTVP